MYYKKYNKTILRKLCKIFLIKTFKIKFSQAFRKCSYIYIYIQKSIADIIMEDADIIFK